MLTNASWLHQTGELFTATTQWIQSQRLPVLLCNQSQANNRPKPTLLKLKNWLMSRLLELSTHSQMNYALTTG